MYFIFLVKQSEVGYFQGRNSSWYTWNPTSLAIVYGYRNWQQDRELDDIGATWCMPRLDRQATPSVQRRAPAQHPAPFSWSHMTEWETVSSYRQKCTNPREVYITLVKNKISALKTQAPLHTAFLLPSEGGTGWYGSVRQVARNHDGKLNMTELHTALSRGKRTDWIIIHNLLLN